MSILNQNDFYVLKTDLGYLVLGKEFTQDITLAYHLEADEAEEMLECYPEGALINISERERKGLFLKTLAKEFADFAKHQTMLGSIEDVTDHFDALEILFEQFIVKAKNGE